MENNERDNSERNIHKSPYKSFKTLFVQNYINAISRKKEHKEEKEKPPEIKESNTKIKSNEIVNIIFTIILAGATVVLAYYTFQLFKETQNARIDNKDAITAAKNSSNAAQNTVAEQRFNDSIMKRNDSIKFINDTTYANKKFFNDSISNKRNSDISKNTLHAQIKSLAQAQNDFEIENRPFMNFIGITLDTTYPNNVLKVSYKIFNVGKFPAKIISFKVKVGYGIDTSNTLTKEQKWYKSNDNEYLPNAGNYDGTVSITALNNSYITEIKKNNIHVYFFCDMYYSSSILKKSYHSYLVYQIDYKPSANVIAIRNDEK